MSATPPTPDSVRQALRGVIDPEVGVDIVSLGLVYGVEVQDGAVTVTFTLTTPGCPLQGVMVEAIRASVFGLPGVHDVTTDLIWEPRWNPGMIENGALS